MKTGSRYRGSVAVSRLNESTHNRHESETIIINDSDSKNIKNNCRKNRTVNQTKQSSWSVFQPLRQSDQLTGFIPNSGTTEHIQTRYNQSTDIELASVTFNTNQNIPMSNSSPNGGGVSFQSKASLGKRTTGITMSSNTYRANGHQATNARSSTSSSSSSSGSVPITTTTSTHQQIPSSSPVSSSSASSKILTSTITTTNRRRSEVDPLLTPPYDPTYSTNDSRRLNSSNMDKHHSSPTNSTHSRSLHSPSQHNDEDTIVQFGDDDELLDDTGNADQALLIVDKPAQIRTQQSNTNVFLLNFLALAFVSFNMTFNLTVLAIIHERVPMSEPHLPDIAFDILPDVRSLLDISEYYIVFQMISLFVLLFFHRSRSIILRRVCIIMGVIYFFRGICMASTQLPLASKNYTCSPQLKNSTDYANMTSLEFMGIIFSRVFVMSLGMGLSINGHHNYCGDYIFSGHTVILLLTYLTFQEYLVPSRRKNHFWRLYQLFLIVMTVVSVACIVIARGHYLIDVILAYFVTTIIFWIYHAMCNSSIANMKSFTPYFSRLWWWPVFLYFENIKPMTNAHSIKSDESPNPVQRIFEWPLPFPKQLARRKHRNQFMA